MRPSPGASGGGAYGLRGTPARGERGKGRTQGPKPGNGLRVGPYPTVEGGPLTIKGLTGHSDPVRTPDCMLLNGVFAWRARSHQSSNHCRTGTILANGLKGTSELSVLTV